MFWGIASDSAVIMQSTSIQGYECLEDKDYYGYVFRNPKAAAEMAVAYADALIKELKKGKEEQ